MDNEPLNYAYDLFVNDGYVKSPEDFNNLMATDATAVDYAFQLFKKDGYVKTIDDFKLLIKPDSPEINHITQEDFLEISSGEFGYFGDGREEIMSAKLYDTYNPDRAEDGIQFTEFGAGNQVRVTLPNGDEEEFDLSGTGKFGEETAKIKADHFRLTKFIDQKKEKEVNPEKRSEFKNTLLNRTESGGLTFGLDNAIAKDLSLLDIKDTDPNSPYKGESYKFEAAKNFENAIEVTLPNGSNKIFNVAGLSADFAGESHLNNKNKTINSILRYIESNPENYTQTEEHNVELKKVEEKIAPFFEEKNINKLFGEDLNALSGTARATMIDKLKTDLGLHAVQLFSGEDEKVFKGLTRDQQEDAINNKITEYVASVTEKYKGVLRAEGNQDNVDQGLVSQEDIDNKYFAKDGAMHSRYDNDFDQGVYLNQLVLDDPDATKDAKDKATLSIENLKTLKEQANLGKKSYYFNAKTIDYEYNTVEDTDAGVYNVNNSVELDNGTTTGSVDDDISELQELMKDGKLTRPELKEKALGINLAVDGWQNNFNKDKQKFYLNQMHGDDIRSSDLLAGGAIRGGIEDAGGGNMRTFVYATDSWAAKNNHMLVDVAMPDEMSKAYNGHLSRMQLGIDLKRSRAVYDKVYGLNETTTSVESEGFVSTFLGGLKESVSGKHSILKSKIDKVDTDQEFRQAMLTTLTDDLGYTPTPKEKYDAKATYGETIGSATSGLPRMVADFAVGNKVLGAIGLNRMVGNLVGNLKKGRYAIKTAKGTEKFNRSQLINHIKNTTGKVKPVKGTKGPGVGQEVKIGNPFKGVKPGSPKEAKILDKWIAKYVAKTGDKIDDIMIPASFTNRAMAVNYNSLFEGVKMEVAMQMPRVHGMGYDPETISEVGGSFATGYGFGFMSGIVPWDKMYRGVMGTKAGITTKAKPGLFKMEAAGKGFRPLPGLSKKEIAFKGIHDYFVAAPINFYAGSQFGGFTNQLADAMMGQKEWGDWLEENYGDWDHVKKHAVSELISGIAMKAHKFNRFDFASESRLMTLRQASSSKLMNEVYQKENAVDKDGNVITQKILEKGKVIDKPVKTWNLRKGKTEADAEKYQSLIEMVDGRLMQMRDMKMYLDPVLGPQKLIQDFKPALKELGVEKDTRFTYDYKIDGFKMMFVKSGQNFYNPKTGRNDGPKNKTGKLQLQGVFNPRKLNPGHVPHELLHIGKRMLFGEDVMFRGKYIDGLVDIAKEMTYPDGRRLYDILLEEGVLKEGDMLDYKQVREHELFSYVGEFFKQAGNQEMLEAKYGYDKLADFTEKMITERFGVSADRLNTRKELVEYYVNYAKSIGEGRGIMGNLKHLEKFISPIKTKRQEEARKQQEALMEFIGVGPTKSLRSRDLGAKIANKEKELKTHPAFLQFKEDKDSKKYLAIPEIQKIQADLKTMRENLAKDVKPAEEITYGQETTFEKTINDFARKDNKMITNAEWNKRGGGKDQAIAELYKEDGAFIRIITKGVSFPIEGRSREQWVEDVSLGIEGKGKKDKATGKDVATFVTKGIRGVLERFKPETDLEGKESLSAWVNRQYQLRRGDVFNYYEKNPMAKPLDAPIGKGSTIGERLLADKDYRSTTFETENILQQEWIKNKEGEFNEVISVEGERKVKNELPIDKEVFEKEGGWQETILKNVPKPEQMKEMGYRDITDLANKFTENMYGVKLTDKQRANPNDMDVQSVKNAQEFIKGEFNVKVMEQKLLEDGKTKTKPRVKENGEPVTRKIKNSNRIADALPDGTVKFDLGVSDALVGRSAFRRLGTLGELYHLATPENYTRAELKKLGFETNETPHKDGYWRAATGPGGRLYIKGKAKGQKLTGENVERYVGIKEDGTLTELNKDRSISGKIRRLINEEGRHITGQTMRESMDLNANILENLKGGKSRSYWSKTLGDIRDAYTRKTILEEVRSATFHDMYYEEMLKEFDKGKKGSAEKATINAVQKHFKLLTIKDPKFKIVNPPIIDSVTGKPNKVLSENQTLKNIAKEVFKEFRFTARPEGIVQGFVARAEKALLMPNTMEGVESNLGLPNIKGPSGVFDKKTIRDGIVYEMREAERLTLKDGVGVYEAHFMAGVSGGGGIGKFSNLAMMDANISGTLRYTIFRSANYKYMEGKGKSAEEGDITYDAYAMLDAVYRKIALDKGFFKIVDGVKVPDISRLKKYETKLKDKTFIPTAERVNQTGVGDKVFVQKKLGFFDKGRKEFNQDGADKLFAYGEKNKEKLLDSVEALADAYKNGNVSQRVVRQWVEMHAGSMDGLIKTSASLAVLPNVKMSDLLKEFPINTLKINKKTGKPERYKKDKKDKQGNIINKKGDVIYESNYVLEHITPAQHVKSKIYQYILSKGDKTIKEAMELTIRDHHTTLIPKKYDTMVNEILQADLPASHLPGMDPLQSRYYEVSHSSDFDLGLKAFAGHRKGITYDHHPNLSLAEKTQKRKEVGENIKKLFPKTFQKVVVKNYNSKNLDIINKIDKALANGRKKDQKARGMSTFDFDKTAGDSDNFIFASKGEKKKKISADKWPFVGEKLVKEGWKMDFTDFNKVTNGRPGPLMQKLKNQIKKYGNENVFILTARAPESAKAIFDFLKSEGAELPLKNITGLGNSTGEAKALWMLEKFSEGYNDMYFVDDALPNVKAVKNVLDQLDIKSNVQVARQFNSKNLNSGINDIMEHSFGVESKKRFSTAEGKVRGKDKKRRKFFMTDSASDLELLIEPLYGKGKKGIEDQKWFSENFYKPWERGINDINTARQTILNDYMSLRKQNKDVVKSLSKSVEGTNFTNDMAARVYIWNKAGFEAPGLTKTSKAKLLEHVNNNPKLQAFAENLARLTKIETGLKQPKDTWWAETIASEVSETGKSTGRKKYINDWIERKNEIFSEENLAKMESELGPKWRESIDNMFYRMETGSTKPKNLGRIGNNIMNYLNGSVGTIMNFNTRSATLQLISTVNFINHAENNPLAATKAFLNQPQYWKDFMRIMNSDMLKQRRDGLQINVTEAELASAAEGGGNTAKKVLAKILKAGYIPTKIADSFAISSGGATYYRNRAKMYQKQGLSLKEAEAKAFLDFQAIAERTQQSSRPDLLSQQQTSFEGRLLLPFSNTPMQMNRIMIKEMLDLSKGRYDGAFGENSFTNKASKVAYYGFVQSAIFAGLQTGLFALMANSDDDEIIAKKKLNAYNTMADSFLRGMGIPGVVVSGVKNAGMKFYEQNQKGYGADYSEVAEALLNMSPTIGSKFSKLDQAGNTYMYNKREIQEKGFSLDNTKALEAAATTIEAITNVPIARVIRKTENIQGALDERNEDWQRGMNALGWSGWDVQSNVFKIEKEEKSAKKKEASTKRAKVKREEKQKTDLKKKEAKGIEKQKEERKQGKQVTCLVCKLPIESGKKYCTIHETTKQRDDGRKIQCRKLKSDGSRCGMQTSNKSGYCYYHD